MDKTVLFEARTNSYHNYRIPGIITAPDGTLLAYCEARKGTGGDWDPIDILMRRSTDHGVTWEAPQKVVDHTQFERGGINNFVAIPDQKTGDVHIIFCRDYAAVYSMKSANSGTTFSSPVEITPVFEAFRRDYPWVVCAAGPGHGIQLQNGRLLVPVWLSTGEGHGRHRPSVTATIYSDDHGISWRCGQIIMKDTETIRNPNESELVELSDGRVLINTRSESDAHRRLISISSDGISNWSPAEFDAALLEPVCMGSIARLRRAKDAILFANPDNLEQSLPGAQGYSHDRKRLTVKLSRNACSTWEISKVIEAGPSGYSDLTEAHDGSILCFYECGYIEKMTDTRCLTVALFTLDWLLEATS